MRREELYLRDIVEAADFVEQFITGLDRAQFQQSELVRSAVAHKLSIVGEAAAHVPEDVRSRHPDVPWPKIVAFRNIMIHAYFGIDWDEVWRAATRECPTLKAQIESVLRTEFGNGP
ncbi:MAG: DUF86 domain-containing protein [Acidobacteriia bacterium]|nr:DUF86 domain-containing protein [Terriglobia bacterium]